MKKLLILMFVASVSVPCIAQMSPSDIDIATCTWRRTGEDVSVRACNEAKAIVADNREAAARQQILADEARAKRAFEDELRTKQETDRAATILENRRKDREINEAAIEKTRNELEAWERNDRASKKASAQREQETKSRCGGDYRHPRIGMPLPRALDCVGKFRLIAEVNRPDGVLATYDNDSMFLHALGGQVVSWGKY